MHINDLPIEIHDQISLVLDYDDTWRKLADLIGISAIDMRALERISDSENLSPTSLLLRVWGQSDCHTVAQLYDMIYRLEHIPALRCFVELG